MQHTADDEPAVLIQSVQRAARLLKVFGCGSPDLGVTELSRTVGLHKSTVSRLLATLEHEGLLERAPGSDRYRLGFEVVRLAGHVPHFGDLRSAAQPVLHRLAEETQETVNLAVLDRDEVINIEQVSGPHLVGVANWIGRRTPLHCVANGKVLLALLPATAIERVLAQPLACFTARTITNSIQLRADLAATRERGYAIAQGEIEEGLNAVASAFCDDSGAVVAAISISGPSYRVTPERLPELGALCKQAAAQIAVRMGYSAEMPSSRAGESANLR